MRHLKAGRKLSRTSSHRKALFRNMVTSLLQHEHIRTTEAKAKELRGFADGMITLAKRGDLHARRQAIAFVMDNEVVKKLFTVLAERYKDRQGGYTRVIKLTNRPGDNAPMAIIELVDRPVKEEPKKSAKKAPAKAAAAEGAAEEKAPKKEKAPKAEGEKRPAARKATASQSSGKAAGKAAPKAPAKKAPEKAKKG
jgi:large subunit ribosomal protein L17